MRVHACVCQNGQAMHTHTKNRDTKVSSLSVFHRTAAFEGDSSCRHTRAPSHFASPFSNGPRPSSRRSMKSAPSEPISAETLAEPQESLARSLEDPQAAGTTGSPSSPFSKWLQLGQPKEPQLLQIETREQGFPLACSLYRRASFVGFLKGLYELGVVVVYCL